MSRPNMGVVLLEALMALLTAAVRNDRPEGAELPRKRMCARYENLSSSPMSMLTHVHAGGN